jgi:exosortase/archaeosortase family protein
VSIPRTWARLAEPLREHASTLWFCARFGLFSIVAFSALYALNDQVVEPFTRGIAWVTYLVVQAIGTPVTLNGVELRVPNFSVLIRNNCNGAYEMGMYAAATLAYPTSLRRRISGILIAVAVLYAVNLIRVLSLLYAGYLFPGFVFEAAHVYVWQVLFVVLIGALWLRWIGWLRPVA